MRSWFLGAIAAAALSSSAQASVLLQLDSVTPDGSNFLYSYSGHITPNEGVVAGDQLVIVDFAGYVAGSAVAPSSDISVSLSNSLPAGLSLPGGFSDDSAIPDLVFTYNGPDFHATNGPFPPDFNFSGLTAESIFGNTTNGAFAVSSVTNVGANAGATTNSGELSVPMAGISPVPEPASWALLLTGFFSLGWMMRRRRSGALRSLASIRP